MLGSRFLSLMKRSLRAWGPLAPVIWTLAGCAAEGPIESTAPVADVKVTPTLDTLRVGESVQLYADPRDARGRILKGRPVAAVSQEPAVVNLLPGGVASALTPGVARVLVTSEGQTATVSITVLAPGPVTRSSGGTSAMSPISSRTRGLVSCSSATSASQTAGSGVNRSKRVIGG